MRLRFTLLTFVAILSLAFAACGGDDDDTADTGDDPSAAAQTDSPDDGDNDTDEGDDEDPTEAESDDDNNGDVGEGSVDACSLLTAEEVESAIGVEMQEGFEAHAVYERFTGCDWNPVDEMTIAFVHIEVAKGDREMNAGTYNNWAEFQELEEVPGLGDRAQWDEFTNQLDVLDGDAYLIVQVIAGFGSEADARTVAEQLAPLALARLP